MTSILQVISSFHPTRLRSHDLISIVVTASTKTVAYPSWVNDKITPNLTHICVCDSNLESQSPMLFLPISIYSHAEHNISLWRIESVRNGDFLHSRFSDILNPSTYIHTFGVLDIYFTSTSPPQSASNTESQGPLGFTNRVG